MAIGKNKRISKGKKGGKKKIIDPYLRKEWYDLRAPALFTVRNFGKTLVTKSAGIKLATDGLRGRVYEVNLADLNSDEDQSFRKMKLICEDIQGKVCYTNFHGMSITRDKLYSLIRKWHSLVEASVDVTTLDGYTLRMFSIGFTKRLPDQMKTTCYAKSSQIRALRKIMVDIMRAQASTVNLRGLVQKFVPEIIGKQIEAASTAVFPLQSVLIRKVKILKKPKWDVSKLMELHEDAGEDTGAPLVEELPEAQNILTASLVE
ncbi:ribosomal protein RPS3A [Cardiosporidium cionae]|uniref:Small ribosomal subunit protein eS1 n=1 Tax=Cardiosporidium cionae TaxID=476202 RepID=A0ABQ7J8C7_9APIC|nr:ribosomal protein RPS3A [Cardiosporidium cionae]|eukprot:KAF8820253.1 ribosomal protein RPS3A [Cardiosporidium cionae]